MLTAYVFCLAVGGGLLALSLFGDFLDADVEVDAEADLELDGADAGGLAKLLSLRTIVYSLFGFGATGTILHAVWDGARPLLTAGISGGTGVFLGVLIGAAFRLLKSSEAGEMLGDEALVGLPGRVSLAIGPGSPGEVSVHRAGRRHRIRASVGDAPAEELRLESGQPVVVVDVQDGVVIVTPVDEKLLEP